MLRTLLFFFLAFVALTILWGATLGRPWAWTHLRALVLVRGVPADPFLLGPFRDKVTLRPIATPDGVAGVLYTPVRHPYAPMIVVLNGMGRGTANDPMTGAFVRRLAESGFNVFVADIPALAQWRIDPATLDQIDRTVRWAAQKSGKPVALFGGSFSGGLALRAAAQPGVADDIRVVFSNSGYDDLNRLARYVTSGREPLPDGQVALSTPAPYGRLLMACQNLDAFVPAADAAPIASVIRASFGTSIKAEQNAFFALTPRQKQELRELRDGNTPAVREEFARALEKSQRESAALSPHGHLASLKARVFLFHAREDTVIPEGESEWILHDLPAGVPAELLTVDFDSHGMTIRGHWLTKLRIADYMAKVLYAIGYEQ